MVQAPEPMLEKIELVAEHEYSLEESFVFGVKNRTSVQTLLSQFKNEELEVTDCDGNVITDAAIVGTGTQVKLYQDDQVIDAVTVVVPGDVDGNGIVDTTDYMRVKATLRDTFTFDDAQTKAADVDNTGMVSTTDYMHIKAYFLGNHDLFG
jgi:hypothetical protein